eukprot:tig00000254_g22551.t1
MACFAAPLPLGVKPSAPSTSATVQPAARASFFGTRPAAKKAARSVRPTFEVNAVAIPPQKEPKFETLRDGIKKPAAETILTPRFYTTDFDALEKLDISFNLEEIEAVNQEFRNDYNRDHFVRDNSFEGNWDHIKGDTRRVFIEFLERSCTAEFSGFLLYKEIARRIKKKNPVLAESMELMARDEARHAGFINKALADFNLQLDLGFLTKNRSYTYFEPKFIIYATYLSEKIGYWRYIKIMRHMQANPECMVYPIFKFFEEWCQDENRHGDFLDALLRSNPQWLNGIQARLWCRFFLLSVFATMYLNDWQRREFYEAIGIEARSYDREVIVETNRTSARVFPVVLDLNENFWKYFDEAADLNRRLAELQGEEGVEGKGKGLGSKLEIAGIKARIGVLMAKCYLIPPIRVEKDWGKAK